MWLYIYIYIIYDIYIYHSFIHSFISIQPQRPGWQEPEPSHVTGVALAHCILGKFFGVVCHCFPPPLDVPTFTARCLYVRNDARDPSSERWNHRRERCPVILPKFRLPRKFRDLSHAAYPRHGTDGFTSPPKEGVLRIFSPLKIRRLRPGLNPRTWVLKASTLPIGHRSRSTTYRSLITITPSLKTNQLFCSDLIC